MPGPPPKAAGRRRRANVPKSYEAATPITAPAAPTEKRELGVENPHTLVARMWEALQISCESRFYSEADWQRARLELWYANAALTSGKPIPGNVWAQVQHGLGALLVSPAEKRRCAIELKPPTPDADADAAVSMMSRYRDKLKPL